MPGGYPWLGYPGSLQQLPSPAPGYAPEDVIRAGRHELLGGGTVIDRIGVRRRYTLSWPAITDTSWNLIRSLVRLPGPFRYQDPLNPNLLTVNQSNGTDELTDTTGFSARTQGSISSSTAQQRSWRRSAAWNTSTNLSSTNRGFLLVTSTSSVDGTWTAVRPSTAYTVSGYLRSSGAVQFKAGFEWYDSSGVIIGSAVYGSGSSVGTSDFNTRISHTATSPSTAAYAVPLFHNSNSPGTTLTIYLDEAMMEEGSSATTFRLGGGTPWVSVESLSHSIILAEGATTGAAYHEVELVLAEVG